MTTELKPCPFCGSADHIRYEFCGSQGFVTCDGCGAEGPLEKEAADPICDVDAAWRAWNTRTPPAQEQDPVSIEEQIISHLVAAWNAHLNLPDKHPDFSNEFRFHIHALQDKVDARRFRSGTAPPANDEAVRLLAEMDEYLDHGHGTSIGSGSIFHQQMKRFTQHGGDKL